MSKIIKEDFSDELLLDIDFSEFDQVIGFQASKEEDDHNEDITAENEPVEEEPDNCEDCIQNDNCIEDDCIENDDSMNNEDDAQSIIEPADDVTDNEQESETDAEEEYLSLAEVYNIRKNFKTNKLVESILCDSVVDNIYDALQSILRAHGISKANAVVVIGLMLDRMLKADDTEVSRPDFLKDVLGDLVDDSEVQKMVTSAVQKALVAKPVAAQINLEPAAVEILSGDEDDVTVVKEEE